MTTVSSRDILIDWKKNPAAELGICGRGTAKFATKVREPEFLEFGFWGGYSKFPR